MDNQAATMETDSSQTSWLYAPNYKVNSQRRETFCWQNLFLRGTFLTGLGGGCQVESVKDLYLVKHKSSQELCIIMINISPMPNLDTVMQSHRELNKGQC